MSKIMIIEDDKVVSKELATLLELSGYTAEILCDFENSLVKYRSTIRILYFWILIFRV